MAVKLKFDALHNVVDPTAIVTNRGGEKLGTVNINGWKCADNMTDKKWFSFLVEKGNHGSVSWDNIADFKLLWIKEWNVVYEMHVDLVESDSVSKNVEAVSLGEAELSQINLYNEEINTEADIERDDYSPSVLYNSSKSKYSILNRILEKAPHYRIAHVDSSISGIQRTFSFNEKTIYDALNEIAKEIQCIFEINCYFDTNGNLIREISAYDLLDHCLNCGERGSYDNVCSECGSSNIIYGYGEDTNIFVSSDVLTDNITYKTDVDSVKNCFALEAGDELMTATIINCNPNGSGNIWYISDELKADMSAALVAKLNAYDQSYDYYLNSYVLNISQDIIRAYNTLIAKYDPQQEIYKQIPLQIVGYPGLMEAYYNTIDFYSYLSHSMMPSQIDGDTTATIQRTNLSSEFPANIAVRNLENASASTIEGSVEQMAKAIVDRRYQVTAKTTSYSKPLWSGTVTITNYKDESDTATYSISRKAVTDEYADYIKQVVTKTVSNGSEIGPYDIVSLFKKDGTAFTSELKKYSLALLKSIKDSCQACLNVLIENGAANKSQASINAEQSSQTSNVYDNVYTPYYNKLGLIENEIKNRENEIARIVGARDNNGKLISSGLQSELDRERIYISGLLNFETFLGETLLKEFSAYRREDVYKNPNYISDGLDNSEIFKNAQQFINVARQDIIKSATLQHSITASLKNLLVIKEFEPIVENFKVGNWIRILIDGNVYRLRLVSYQIDSSQIDGLTVAFSDVVRIGDALSDIESILNNANSMATSYDFVARQAKKGSDADSILANWVENSLSLTNMKITSGADNQNIEWDKHGLSCKEYIPEYDEFDDRQLKIINRGLYLTDDNWKNARAAVGSFLFYNPATKQYEESYGVIADTIVGNLVLSKDVGIYTEKNNITLNENGFELTADMRGTHASSPDTAFLIQKLVDGSSNPVVLMQLDTNGNLLINGSTQFISTDGTTSSFDDISGDISSTVESIFNTSFDTKFNTASKDLESRIEFNADQISKFSASIKDDESIKNLVGEVLNDKDGIVNALATQINQTSQDVTIKIGELRSQVDGSISQMNTYFAFDNNGLTLGKSGNPYNVVITNNGMNINYDKNVMTTVDESGLHASQADIETLHVGTGNAYTWSYNADDGHLTLI